MGFVEIKSLGKGIEEICFFHEAQNSLPSWILKELTLAITEMGSKKETSLIILKSGGDRTFCSGASFTELASIKSLEEGRLFFSGFSNVINAIRKCGKIVLGRVQGKAVGGGVGLASAVDHCFATQNAQVKLSELAVGIGPFVVGPAVERKIGLSAFSQMTLNAGGFYSADWAKSNGLFSEVFETTEEMDLALLKFAEKLADSNPEALLEIKTMFWKGTEHWDELLPKRAEISGRLVLSEFTRKALEAYVEKAKT